MKISLKGRGQGSNYEIIKKLCKKYDSDPFIRWQAGSKQNYIEMMLKRMFG